MSSITTSANLSVIVPFYTGLRELKLTLAGLSRQKVPADDFEVIVAEDGGPACPRSLAALFPNLCCRFVRIERNGFRLATVRNVAIEAARYERIVMLDFDCIPLTDHLYAHLEGLGDNPDQVTIGLRRFVDSSNLLPQALSSSDESWADLPDVPSISNSGRSIDKRIVELRKLEHHPFPCNLFHGCNVGFWRAAGIAAGLFNERFNGAHGYEDIEFAYRLQRRGAQFRYVDAPVLHQENDVVSCEERRVGKERNYAVLRELCPDLVAYREHGTN